jgi:hypothetical protein
MTFRRILGGVVAAMALTALLSLGRNVEAVNFLSVSASPGSCHAPCTVNFVVGSDCNGCTFTWTDNGAPAGSGVFMSRSYSEQGSHVVTVTANDTSEGNSKSASATVVIQ